MDYTRQAKEVLKIAEKVRKRWHILMWEQSICFWDSEKIYTGVAAQVLGANGVDEENIQKVMLN